MCVTSYSFAPLFWVGVCETWKHFSLRQHARRRIYTCIRKSHFANKTMLSIFWSKYSNILAQALAGNFLPIFANTYSIKLLCASRHSRSVLHRTAWTFYDVKSLGSRGCMLWKGPQKNKIVTVILRTSAWPIHRKVPESCKWRQNDYIYEIRERYVYERNEYEKLQMMRSLNEGHRQCPLTVWLFFSFNFNCEWEKKKGLTMKIENVYKYIIISQH